MCKRPVAAQHMTYADEAAKLVLGDRNESYGTPVEDYARTSAVWSGLLIAKLREPITPKEAVLMMAALKLCREMHQHKPDNLVDAHGYLLCAEWVENGARPEPQAQVHEDTIETVCCGTKLECPICGKPQPCNCDHTSVRDE